MKTNSTSDGQGSWVPPEVAERPKSPSLVEPQPEAPLQKAPGSGDVRKQAEKAGKFAKTYKREQQKEVDGRSRDLPPRPPAKVGAPSPPAPAGARDVGAVDLRSTSSRAGAEDSSE